MSLSSSLKKYFFRGLAVLLPTILTIGILVWGYHFIQGTISAPINKGLVWLVSILIKADVETKTKLSHFFLTGPGSITGFIIAVIIVIIVGAILASVIGKTLWHMIERSIMKIPLLNRVYPYLKQVTDFFFEREKTKQTYTSVVAMEYPSKGIWSMGLITGSGIKELSKKINTELLTVFIPHAPSPITGFIIMVPKDQVIFLEMSVEEFFRYTISGGVIHPEYIEDEQKR